MRLAYRSPLEGDRLRGTLSSESFRSIFRPTIPIICDGARPYQIVGVGLVVSELVFVLMAPVLSVPLLLVAILVPLLFLILLSMLYRRRLKAFKSHWSDEHP